MTKNRIMTPHKTSRASNALNGTGNENLPILMFEKRSTSGRPTIERTPETRI